MAGFFQAAGGDASGQLSRPVAPVVVPRWTGLAPIRESLGNGGVVIAKSTRRTPAVAIDVAVRAGSVCDPAEALGAMNLLARVIDRGTATRSAADIAEELDSRGVSLITSVNRHFMFLLCTCLAADFEPTLSLIGEVLAEPSLPASEVEMRRREVVTGIRQDQDNPAVRAVETLMDALYGSYHPYGRSAKGTIESVGGISRGTLAQLHRTYVTASGLSVVIVGDVEASRMTDVARSVFDRWSALPSPSVALEQPVPVLERRRLVVPMMNKAQVDIAYGFTALQRSDPAYYALWLVNNALGQYALGGRLGESIRERQGMAYYVSSVLDANVLKGPLVIRAGVNASNVDRTIASIDHELTRLRQEGLTAAELQESRQYLVGAMPRALETNAGIAHFLQTAECFGLGLDYDQRLPGLLGKVTLEEANAVARQVVDPDRATIAVAGPCQG